MVYISAFVVREGVSLFDFTVGNTPLIFKPIRYNLSTMLRLLADSGLPTAA